jgi:putative protein-disulfide isomerase
VAVVSAVYYTDPACPRSWAAEPTMRRLQREFGESLSFTYVMGGLARDFERPLEALRGWLDAAAETAMPVDPRLWLDAPPKSSYPACLAVHAAAEQGLAAPFLRRAREALAFEGRRLDRSEPLIDLAREVPGINVERFVIDLGSHAIVEAFGADLERTRAAGPDGLPRLELLDAQGAQRGELRAPALLDPEVCARAVREAGARPSDVPAPSIEQALRAHARLATPEVAAACDLPGPRAAAELWRLAADWRVRPWRHLSGETWTLA